jgi:CheY-like chemotaxis protein
MKNILLAEDNQDDVFIMKRAMKAAGFNVSLQVAPNGQETVDYLAGKGQFADREKYPLPCLLLLDMKMPYLSGLDVIKWIRRDLNLATLLVVFLTSSRDDMDIDQAYRFGANAYLVKPPDSQKLVEMLESLKTFWLTHNQFPPNGFPLEGAVAQPR